MLTIGGRDRAAFCDGVTRRDFLRVGGLAMGGLALPDLLRAEDAGGVKGSHKAVIMIFLAGGPPHQDMFDLKPDAPEAIRGEYRPISTNVPGLRICEHLPRLAAIADKYAVIRSVVGAHGDHSAGQCLTGFADPISKSQGGRPSLGSIVSKLQGAVDPTVPAFVGLSPRTGEPRWGNPGDPGYLGPSHAPFAPFRADGSFGDDPALNPRRIGGRRALLERVDSLRRRLDARGEAIEGLDAFTRQAYDILASGKLFKALDVTREDPRLRARYGVGDMVNEGDGPPSCNDQFLMARRLVEAGARCVTVAFGRWDNHSNLFPQTTRRLPKLDQALSALLEDLHARGLDEDVSVVVWGEFGRTPAINPRGGRDHWPRVSFALMAGGGMKTGQVIGSTDREAGSVKDRPVPMQSVFATLYHNLGIGPEAFVYDRSGRPMPLLDHFEPIKELI